MNIAESLKPLGLNEKQAKVYVALLELGRSGVGGIAKKAGLKRPTVYLIAEELLKMGLATTTSIRGALAYAVEPPSTLLEDITQKQKALAGMLPTLETLYRQKTGKPTIKFYEGLDEMRKLYRDVYRRPVIHFWGSVSFAQDEIHGIVDEFHAIIQKHKPTVYDLLDDTPEDRAYAKHVARLGNEQYHIRFLPKGCSFNIDCAIVDNRVYFFSYSPERIAVVVESSNIVASLRTLHQLAWQMGIPFTSLKK